MGRLDFIQVLLVICIDLLYGSLHGLPGAGILAGEENAKAGANNHTDEADHNNHQHGNPTASGDGRDQSLGGCNDGFHRRNRSLDRCLCRNYRSSSRYAGGMSCSPGRPRRGLGSPLGSFSRLLAGLDTGLGSLFRRFDGFAGGFYRPLGCGRSLLDGFAAPVHCLNAFLTTVQGLDGPALLTDRLGRLVFSAVRLRLSSSGFSP